MSAPLRIAALVLAVFAAVWLGYSYILNPAYLKPRADLLQKINRSSAALAGYRKGQDDHARVLGDFRPLEAAVEQTFVNRDGASTLKLGQARGVAMLAPAIFGISVAEYAPNQVKKTVVGAGHADKNQIRVMLGVLLPKADPQTPDAADALAIAITHAHHRQNAMLKLRVAGA